ncbi:alpha-1,2-fucosyltransferase [Rhodobacteraceae bacterium RKSG542]|uniref:alpha-1,2-fucosyltransferase n=1 Tax=Pseudovibrio flavus TaxID=2529854 RepID=UPI0012BD800B|nr:alpha-1,2-fucosyltransferase [Pseudovibrio flavus]MTI18563.1 alpha-1,2-fucosyltransferase [Pseudovibrio flavus]
MRIAPHHREFGNIIVTKLQGGLGNILFQYLAGLALAERHGCPLYCAQDGGVLHHSGLELVGVEPQYIDLPSSLMRRSRRKKDKRLTDHVNTMLDLWPLKPCTEPHFHYWPEFESLPTGILLSGYWQSPRYFARLKDRLLDIVKLGAILDSCDQGLVSQLRRQETVSVHIRRGDFQNNPEAKAIHGILDKDYYDRARYQLERGHTSHIYCVFSDAPEEAKNMLSDWDNTLFICGNSQQQDLALMSCCDHNIIANSSFSWWGAMLNTNPAKQVITPKQWFTVQALKSRSVKDLVPDTWSRV